MTTLNAVILGVIQGLTEFLPISSSGHLVIAQQLMGIKEHALAFDIVIHIATLLAVLCYFWKDVCAMTIETIRWLTRFIFSKEHTLSFDDLPNAHKGFLILVASVPTGIMGVAFVDLFEAMFSSIFLVGVTWVVVGVFLIESRKFKRGTKTLTEMSIRDALLVGVLQGVAIVPGISRSAATILIALYLGYAATDAAEFSFLISIPAVLGAIVVKGKESFMLAQQAPGPLWAGFLSSGIVGFLVIFVLLDIIRRGKFHAFGYYSFFVGLAVSFYGLV